MRGLAAAALAALLLLAAAPASAHSGYPNPPRRLVRVAQQEFGPHWRTAVCVSAHESGYNTWSLVGPWSWSVTGDHSWWQINYITWRSRLPSGAWESEWQFHIRVGPLRANARQARSISRGGTYWYPWTVYRTGHCRGLG